MNKKFTILALAAIMLIASVLRLWQLGNVPPSPDWDEAALAYNAFSIIQTGKDEFGSFMPIVLQSFGDYKPALYVYLAVPFIALFGLETFAIRLPSVILGIVTVLAVYFLVKTLFEILDSKPKKSSNLAVPIALVSALLLAISPWHIQFSRVAFESNVGLAFNIFGAFFFVKGLKKPWLLLLATFFWGLSVSVYQSERVFTPLLFLTFVIIFRKDLLRIPKKFIVGALIIGLITILPLIVYASTEKDAFARAKGVSLLSQQTELLKEENAKLLEDKNSGNVLGMVLHNRRVVYAQAIVGGYLSHFDFNWLFITSDLERHHAPGMGLLYLWELLPLLVGFYMLIFVPFPRRAKAVIFAWMLLAPVPASITTDVPHAVRTLNFLPTFQVLTAIGLVMITQKVISLRSIVLRRSIFIFAGVIILFNFLYFLNQYFVQQNYYYSKHWQYGYKQAVEVVRKHEKEYDKIVVSNITPLDQSYIFFLYYLGYSPQEYQNRKSLESHDFGKYEFRKIEWKNDSNASRTLFVGEDGNFTEKDKATETIYYLNGKPAIKIVGTK